MNREVNKTGINKKKKLTNYQNLSLVELIERIVKKSDRLALNEFHSNRSVFWYKGEDPLRFTEYLYKLKEDTLVWGLKLWDNANDIVNNACDLTIDKFSNLPETLEEISISKKKSNQKGKVRGPDCRQYLKAFLNSLRMRKEFKDKRSQIEEELSVTKALENFVRRNFYFSLKESIRNSSPFVSRYFWKTKGGTLYLWFPSHMTGRERREWLETNIKDVDPFNPEERERIQTIINKELIRERFVSIEDHNLDTRNQSNAGSFLEKPEFAEIRIGRLSDIVAEEKIVNIKSQRPSIQSLGKEKLKEIILYIFEALSNGEYKDVKIAQKFGLSKATFSRFAGSRWRKQSRGRKKLMVPDLWKNTAQILAKDPIFREVAKDAGVWQEIEKTVQIGIAISRRRNSNE